MVEGKKLDAVVSYWYSNFAVRHINCMRQHFNSKLSFLGFYLKSIFPSRAKIKTGFLLRQHFLVEANKLPILTIQKGFDLLYETVIAHVYVWYGVLCMALSHFFWKETFWWPSLHCSLLLKWNILIEQCFGFNFSTLIIVALAPASIHVAKMSVNCPTSDRDVGVGRSDCLLIPQLSGWYSQGILKFIHNFKSDTVILQKRDKPRYQYFSTLLT